MESHMHGASGSSPDVSRIQQGYNIQQPGPGPRGSHRPHSDRSMFGVRIQVQGIEGLPYAVLNNRDSRAALPSGGLESYSRNWDHQEVSVNAHSQSEYASIVNDKPSPLGSPYVERRLPNRQGEYALGGSLTVGRESQRTPLMSATSMFDIQESHLQQSQRTMPASNMELNFQRHPELLKPYNPDRISLSSQHPLLFSTRRLSVPPTQTASVPRPGHLARGLQSGAGAARIPLPAGGVESAPNPVSASTQTQSPGPAPVSAPALHHSSLATLLSPPNEVINVPRRSPYSVDTEPISSVGSLINQFDSPQQVGQAGPRRGRIAPEDRRRSRSVESRQERHSDPSSPASAIRGARRETAGRATIAPGSRKGRGANGNSTLMFNKLQWEKEKEPSCYVIQSRVEKTSLTRSRSLNHTEEESERGIQIITLDLLKGQRGQQEFSTEPQPNEDATKKILFTYLKDGTIDKTSTTQKKVNLVFDRINQLKWKTAENVEEEIRDYSAKAKELQKRGAELEREVSQLKTQLEHKTMSGWSLAEVCYKAQTDMKTIQEELGRRQEELSTLRDRLAQKEAELEVAVEELVQVKAESEQGRTETKDLQQQLSEMHDELDQAKSTTQADSTEKQLLLKDLAQLRLDFQELILVQEEQEEVVHWKERELTALKGALKEEVESHDKELGIMKEVQNKEVQKLREEVEEVKESNTVLGQVKREMEEDRGEAQGQVNELMQEREELRGQVEELESRMEQLNLVIKDSKTLQRQLVKCIEQHKRAKQQIEETLVEVREKEEEMSRANKALLIRLENVQSEMSQLNHQHREVKERLKEERSRVEELRMIKTDLEEERRLYNNTVEELQKKISVIVEGCEVSTEKLQLQVDEVREKSHTELSELQQQLQGKGVDLEKSRQTVRKLQEELLPLEQGLERCRREWEEAQQRGRELERKGEELEKRSTHTQEDHARQVKLMEGQMGDLEHDLSEERSSVDLLMDRVDQGKQQMEQIRVELLQERAVRQDLECDKITLERRNKDLKSRVSHLEGSQRPNQDVVVSRLEGRIQELEGRLEGVERDNINLQQANRKLERKVKEMMMQVDDEHISMQNQKDQLNQRLKTAKRQMDGAEEEIERLENSKRKLQRDLDEQMETNDQVLSQLNALRSEMRRKQQKSAPFLMIEKDDDAVFEDDISSD